MTGTQLAAGDVDGTVIAWSYPSGEIFFQMNELRERVDQIKWNPFREDVFVTRGPVVKIAVHSLLDSHLQHLFVCIFSFFILIFKVRARK